MNLILIKVYSGDEEFLQSFIDDYDNSYIIRNNKILQDNEDIKRNDLVLVVTFGTGYIEYLINEGYFDLFYDEYFNKSLMIDLAEIGKDYINTKESYIEESICIYCDVNHFTTPSSPNGSAEHDTEIYYSKLMYGHTVTKPSQ